MLPHPGPVSIPLRKFRKRVREISGVVLSAVSIPLRKFRKEENSTEAEEARFGFHPSKEV